MKKFLIFVLTAMFSMAAWASGAVNGNKASAQEIAESLKGVGLSKAEAIVNYRNENGPFKHMDELVNVKGIGIRTDRLQGDLGRFCDFRRELIKVD